MKTFIDGMAIGILMVLFGFGVGFLIAELPSVALWVLGGSLVGWASVRVFSIKW